MNTSRRSPSIPLIGLAIALVVTSVTAGAAPRPPGYTREVEAVLGEMLSAYRSAESYRDNGRLTVVQKNGRVRQITKMPSTTALSRPGKIRVLGGMQSISSDGEQLQIVLDALRQYQQRPAPARLDMDRLRFGAPGAGLDEGYPEILEFLLGEDVLERWISRIRKISIANRDTPAVVAERECITLSYETVHGAQINLFIDSATHMLLRCDIDNTAAQRSPNAPQTPGGPQPTLQVVLQFDPVEPGAKLEDADFALSDPSAQGMRLVEVFEAEAPAGPDDGPAAATTESLVGAQAPELAARIDETTEITKASLSGKPALLLFWSPNAGPGNLAALRMMERLREKSGEKATVFGIAGAGSDPRTVSELLKAKRVSYANAIDSGGDIARRYHIQALPAYVLIGSDGEVRHVSSGDPAAVEKEIAEQLQSATTAVVVSTLTKPQPATR